MRRANRVLAVMASVMFLTGTVTASVDPIDAAWRLADEGRDLSAVELLRSLSYRPDGSIANDMAVDTVKQLAPRLNGLSEPTIADAAAVGPPASVGNVAAVTAAERRDAIAAITAKARDRRIVILNEAHDSSEDRAFGLAVARALRPLGFTMLAAETFNNADDPADTDMTALGTRGYPVRNRTGVYTTDPVFGDFVRQALALGYHPVAYEQTAEQRKSSGSDGLDARDRIDAREAAQAVNLAAAIAAAPGAKFFIYCGYSHATKVPLPEQDSSKNHLWMAGRLKQMTGLDPLSIDQTDLGATNVTQASRTLRGIVQQHGSARPVVLFANGKPLLVGRYRDAVDMQVVHPVTRIVHGRPDWLASMGRHPVRPAMSLVPASGRALVQAFLAREGSDAIPVDQAVLEPHDTRWFMLPDQPVRFVVRESLPTR